MTFEARPESVTFELGVETECEQEHAPQNEELVTPEASWTPSQMRSFHLIWPRNDWSEKSRVEWSTAWTQHRDDLHRYWDDLQVRSWSIWLDHTNCVEPFYGPLRLMAVLYGGLIWVGNDISWPTCSWRAWSPEWPSHCRTDFVNPLTAMNFLRVLTATWFADKSGIMTAPDMDVIVSMKV